MANEVKIAFVNRWTIQPRGDRYDPVLEIVVFDQDGNTATIQFNDTQTAAAFRDSVEYMIKNSYNGKLEYKV